MVEALLTAGISALLYHVGIGVPAFLIPLGVARARGGPRGFAVAAVIAFAAIAGIRLALLRGGLGGDAAPWLVLELGVVAALIGGLAWTQAEQPALPGGRVVRLLTATAAVGLLSLPLTRYLAGSAAFAASLRQAFDLAVDMLNQVFGSAGAGVRSEQLSALVREVFLRSFLLTYLLVLSFNWWAGSLLGARLAGRPRGVTRLQDFRPPEWLVWPLIAGLALVLLTLFVKAELLGIGGWNLLLVMLFFYGLAGLGILRSLLLRFGQPRGAWTAILLALVVMFFIPGANLVPVILVPGLGVSETWVRYRKFERSEV